MDVVGLFLLYWWVVQLFYKLTDFDQLDSKLRYKLPQNKVGNFFYKLFSCQFCMESHIGVLITLPISANAMYFVLNNGASIGVILVNLHFILIGWLFAAISHLIKKTSR